MGKIFKNKIKKSKIGGDCIAGDKTYNTFNSYVTLQDKEREFIVTHNADIKPTYYFTGRETELEDLRQRIEEGRKFVLVSGMGGIGKTHICRKLFEEYQKKHKEKTCPFEHIGYIEYNGDMDSSLQNCLKFKEQDNPEHNQEAAWRELEDLASDRNILLFIDNVNVLMKQDKSLERLKSIPGAIVLTSRRTTFGKEFEPYRIGFLDMKQCKRIYEKIRYSSDKITVPDEEIPDLEYIIEKLAAYHTITVEFLAHLAYTRQWTAKELRNELEDKGFRIEYKNEEEDTVNIQKSYETLYDLSELNESEQNILEAFSVFPYIPLSSKICNEWLLEDAGVVESDDTLMGLYQKGWLQLEIKQSAYAMHPVFAQFIYEKCKPNAEKHMGLIGACENSLKIPDSGYLLECLKYISFAENIAEKIDVDEGLEQAEFLATLALLLSRIGDYKKAERMYKKSLRIKEKALGEEKHDTAILYGNMAGAYYNQGKYVEAEELYKKSLRIKEKVLGKDNPDTATSYNNLAGVYVKQGKYAEAEELYKKSLRIREKMLGEEHPDTAIIYSNLAFVYDKQRKYAEAEELYKKSLRISEKVLGEEHPDTAISYNNLAGFYIGQKKNVKLAFEYYVKAYKIFLCKLGLNHPKTKTVMKNLESAYTEYYPDGNFEQWLEEKLKE